MASTKYAINWAITIHFLLILGAWFLFHLTVKPWYKTFTNPLENEIIYAIAKTTIWVVPAVFLIKRYEEHLPFSFRGMFLSQPNCNKTFLMFRRA